MVPTKDSFKVLMNQHCVSSFLWFGTLFRSLSSIITNEVNDLSNSILLKSWKFKMSFMIAFHKLLQKLTYWNICILMEGESGQCVDKSTLTAQLSGFEKKIRTQEFLTGTGSGSSGVVFCCNEKTDAFSSRCASDVSKNECGRLESHEPLPYWGQNWKLVAFLDRKIPANTF